MGGGGGGVVREGGLCIKVDVLTNVTNGYLLLVVYGGCLLLFPTSGVRSRREQPRAAVSMCMWRYVHPTKPPIPDRLVGLVVRRPPRERKIPGSNPACAGIFSGSSHTSD